MTGSDGKPVADAVVSLDPASGQAPAPRMQGKYEVTQKDTMFHPFVTVVPIGATVSFPNLDPFRHHVYSFSPTKRFELKLFAKDQTRSITFDKAGIVAVGCNIHDSMSAFIYVTDSVWTVRTDASGNAVIRDVPAQAMKLTVWHPYLSAPGNQIAEMLPASAADRARTMSIKLRPSPMNHMSSY
ncbi:MAG TPA: methylamine utilization protein [Sphingobium sp.]